MQDYVLTVKQSATFSTQTVVKFKFKLRTVIGKPLSVKPKYVWTLKVISMDTPSIALEAPSVWKRCRITRGEKENKIQVPRISNVLRETKREKRRNKERVRMERGRRIRRRLATHGCIRVYVKHIQGRLHGPHKGLVRGIIRSCPYTSIRKYVTSARVPTEMGGKVFCYQQPDNAECAALAGTRYYATACWMTTLCHWFLHCSIRCYVSHDQNNVSFRLNILERV